MYAFITRRREDAYVVFRVEENERAVKILGENGISVVTPEEIFTL